MRFQVISETRTLFRVALLATFILAVGLAAIAQQQGGSLADTARQIRAQKQGQSQTQGQAQQFADELSEDQSENGAPGGFKTFNTGSYKIWVPAPYHMDGNDAAGPVLSGPMSNGRRLVVLLGTPVVAHFENDDAAFQETALKFAHLYADQTNCTKTTVAGHDAYECGMAAANLSGQRVTGNAVFVRSLGNIYPVFCVTPSDSNSRDFINTTPTYYNKAWAEKSLAKETDEMKNALKGCDTVFRSIHIPEGISAQKSAANIANGAPPQPSQPAAVPASSGGTPEANHGSVPTSMQTPMGGSSSLPPGVKVQAFTYCATARDCFDASVLVPTEAQLLSSDCKQYVFETKIQGQPFLLLAGTNSCTGRNPNDANLVRWNQLVLPETQRAPGTASTVTALQGTVDGKPAVITTMRFKNGLADWMGKRAEIESNGVQLVVGCMGPREHFADADAACSALIDSLRLP
jgi:hypothetical protein